MKKKGDNEQPEKSLDKKLIKIKRKLARAEERLVDYERIVDRTQHLLNTRIEEVEAAHAELQESEGRFRQLAEASFEAIIIHADGTIRDCNEAATQLYQLSRKKLIGSSILERVHPSSHEGDTDWLRESVGTPVELTHVRSDDSPIPVEVRSQTILHHGDEALVTAVRDITAHKEMEAKLKEMANSDSLTGLGNRRFFMDAGKREYYRALRYAQPVALMMIDADYFKRINDTYGHDAGDAALCALAKVCRHTLRDSDVLARIGGEEFAVVLPNSDLEGAAILAERLRANVEADVVGVNGAEIRFTVSLGVTGLRAEDEGIEGMLNRADRNLYRAKEDG
ncbi:MAG: hypothetical protein DRQ37_06980, partial [Gammaproteobacteria bacterium]